MSDLEKDYPHPVFRKFILVKAAMNWKALESMDSPVVCGLINQIPLSVGVAVSLQWPSAVAVCCTHENRVWMTALAAFIDFILCFKKHMGLELLNEKTLSKKRI